MEISNDKVIEILRKNLVGVSLVYYKRDGPLTTRITGVEELRNGIIFWGKPESIALTSLSFFAIMDWKTVDGGDYDLHKLTINEPKLNDRPFLAEMKKMVQRRR